MKPPRSSAEPMRIWYQSFTDHAETKRYHDRLSDYVSRIARPGTRIDVVGMNPPSRRHRTTEMRCAVDVVKNAIRAERAGYDAFLLGHFQDSGLWDARSAVSIPVIGLGESAMLHACTLGRKIGLITIHPVHIPFHEDQVLRYGLQQRVVAVTAVNSSPADYVKAFQSARAANAVGRHYAGRIRALVAQGIEVVVPAGGLPSLLLADQLKLSAGNAVVLDGIFAAVRATEAAVDLRRFNGTGASRLSTFQLPSALALEALGMGAAPARPRPRRR